MQTAAETVEGWIERKATDPIPDCRYCFIRSIGGWESNNALPPSEWIGWETPSVIIAYRPEGGEVAA